VVHYPLASLPTCPNTQAIIWEMVRRRKRNFSQIQVDRAPKRK
jgi:hypothetical protein